MDRATIQAVLVDVNGVGVLLRGPAGSGKSLAALHLMDRGHRLVADDVVIVSVDSDGELVGRALEEDQRIEVRGLGIFRVKSLFEDRTAKSGAIHLVLDVDRFRPEVDAGRVTPQTAETEFLGKKVPCVRMALPHGADLALMVELLAAKFARSGTVIDE